ncbi:L,D-transpeptidase family protein [Sphingomonas sp. KR1UV-12]|uniref:L,D-transpeptidase family protein n=2 Tax=Sphingomonas aurea TaxID=3063994 RepID=A0ABT9EGI9_9SPHN|nr:L,D-transpeptidase family protein [Sphingomonas sp. KR1UV-12]MDP1026085.1 L,D-transpeptidase family protein [Sphingomonas sp. KR1UV-12]
MQVVLDRLGFSPGVIDGRPGMSLTAAIKGFQQSRDLPETGKPDAATMQALAPYWGTEATKVLTLNARVLAGPYVNPIPKDEDQQARLPGLYYRSPLEKLAEMFHTTPQVLVALNSPQTWLRPGSKVEFPNVLPSSRAYDSKLRDDWRATLNGLNVDAVQPQAAKIVVDKSDKVLRVYDDGGKLVAQFGVTTGSEHDPLPLGNWKINGADYNPKFHFNPDLFWDAKKDDEKAMLPPGPNGPVGVVWLDLSKPHYGIHGTPNPELIGRSESHGCVRLTNWNAARLAMMVKPGTPVVFQA